MSLNLPPELADQLGRRIDCPVSWCSGIWLEHGGDGASPDEWVHDDPKGIALPYGAHLYRSQMGAGPVEWSLTVDGDGQRVNLAPASLTDYVKVFREIAAAISLLDDLEQ